MATRRARALASHRLGPSVEIGAGLEPGARVVDNPPEALRTGDLVRVVPAATAGKPG